jgi:hypothetical protein
VPCGTPTNPDAAAPVASDALFALQAAVGLFTCDTRVCDTDGNATIAATDALLILRKSVGDDVTLECSA